jgi:hypothetical protein
LSRKIGMETIGSNRRSLITAGAFRCGSTFEVDSGGRLPHLGVIAERSAEPTRYRARKPRSSPPAWLHRRFRRRSSWARAGRLRGFKANRPLDYMRSGFAVKTSSDLERSPMRPGGPDTRLRRAQGRNRRGLRQGALADGHRCDQKKLDTPKNDV